MKIKVVMVGKVREKYLAAGIEEYLKRLGPFAKVELVSLQDDPTPDGASLTQQVQVKDKEGDRILRELEAGHYVVALDIWGAQVSSEDLAGFLAERALRGQSNLAFIIGGSLGLSSTVLERADFRLSLGRMTFPHQMVPMILLEQIYRAFKINRGEPYHK